MIKMDTFLNLMELQNKTTNKLINTGKKPLIFTQNVYELIYKEVKEYSVKKSEGQTNRGMISREKFILSGERLMNLFLKEDNRKEENYCFDFYIKNEILSIQRKENLPVRSQKIYKTYDIIDEMYPNKQPETDELKTTNTLLNMNKISRDFHKVIKEIDGVMIEINFHIIDSFSMDFAFLEFYYNGGTIYATERAIRDVDRNEISVNTVKTPFHTLLKLKEYQNYYNFNSSEIEEHLLTSFLKISTNKKEIIRKIKEEFPENISIKIKTDFLTKIKKPKIYDDIYTENVEKLLEDNKSVFGKNNIISIFERKRKMIENNWKEEDLSIEYNIILPEFRGDKEIVRKYEENKEKIWGIVKDYNRKNRLEYIYKSTEHKFISGNLNEILMKEMNVYFNHCLDLRVLMKKDKTMNLEEKEICDEKINVLEEEKFNKLIKKHIINIQLDKSNIYVIYDTRYGIPLKVDSYYGISSENFERMVYYKNRKILARTKRYLLLDDLRRNEISKVVKKKMKQIKNSDCFNYEKFPI
jgi:hypothetical protein